MMNGIVNRVPGPIGLDKSEPMLLSIHVSNLHLHPCISFPSETEFVVVPIIALADFAKSMQVNTNQYTKQTKRSLDRIVTFIG